MKEEEADALFLLAGFNVIRKWRLANRYWPPHPEYYQIREDNPWWLVDTEFGRIEIGKRKRVYVLNWCSAYVGSGKIKTTPFRKVITPEEDEKVTHDETMTHAWGMPKLLEYMTILFHRMKSESDLADQREAEGC